MISLQRSMHSSQMYTPGPAMSFLTCFWLLPQNEHLSRSPPSPMRATGTDPFSQQSNRAMETYSPDPVFDGTVPGDQTLRSTTRCDYAGGERRTPLTAPSKPRTRSDPGRDRRLEGLQHVIDQPVLHGLLRGQELVPFDVTGDLRDRL